MGELINADQAIRPLSPHLTIYRPQLTSVSSILIRITGNALIFCVVLIIWWFLQQQLLNSILFLQMQY